MWFLFTPLAALASVCPQWSEPVKVGALETNFINEASGLAVSRQFMDRLYHHNDSGDGPYFYISDGAGGGTRRLTVPGMIAKDLEDLAIGPCGADTCLFLGDIGDNARTRGSLDLWLIPEVDHFPESVAGARKITVRYPDHAHDAEALAVHPASGDVYLFTKEADYKAGKAFPGLLFRLPASALLGEEAVWEKVAEIDLPYLNAALPLFGQVATAMDISADGERLMLLTYSNAVEISLHGLSRSTREWKMGEDYSMANWPEIVTQQEAAAYAADGRSFFFDTEFNPDHGDKDAGIYRVDCR